MSDNEELVDHYSVLGVSEDADPAEIKSAYRKQRVKAHPDTEGGSAERFREVAEAWEVLGDPDKRAAYDLLRSTPAPQAPQSAPQGAPPPQSPTAPAQAPQQGSTGRWAPHQAHQEPQSPAAPAQKPAAPPQAKRYAPSDNRTDLKDFKITPPASKTFYPKLLAAVAVGAVAALVGVLTVKTYAALYVLAILAVVVTAFVNARISPREGALQVRHIASALGVILVAAPLFILKDSIPAGAVVAALLYLVALGGANLLGGKWEESTEFDKLIPPKVIEEGRVFGKVPTDITPGEAALLRELQEQLSPVTFNVDGSFLIATKFQGAGMFWLIKGNRVVVVSPLVVPYAGGYGFSSMGYITTATGEHFPHQADALMELVDDNLKGLGVETYYLFALFPQGGGATQGAMQGNITLAPLTGLAEAADALVSAQEDLVRRDVLRHALQFMPN